MSIKFNGRIPERGCFGRQGRCPGVPCRSGQGAWPADRRARPRVFSLEISSLNNAIGNLNTQINALSSASPNEQTTNQITDLVNQRSADQSQISQLQAQIQQALLNEQSADDVSHVLDPAALVPVSAKKSDPRGRPLGTRRGSRSRPRRRDLQFAPLGARS